MRYFFLFATVFLFFGTISEAPAHPRAVPPPPRVVWPVIRTAPAMALVPGTDVWFHTTPKGRVYFHAGAWWWHSAGVWYRASTYQGPWVVAAPAMVPIAITVLPWHRPVFYPDIRPVPYPVWHERVYGKPVFHKHPHFRPVPPPPRHPAAFPKHAKPAAVVWVQHPPHRHH